MGKAVRPVECAQQLVIGKSQAFDLPKIQQPHDFMLGIDALAAPLIPGHVEQADAFIIAQRVHADAEKARALRAAVSNGFILHKRFLPALNRAVFIRFFASQKKYIFSPAKEENILSLSFSAFILQRL